MTDDDTDPEGLMLDPYRVTMTFTLDFRTHSEAAAESRARSLASKFEKDSAFDMLDLDGVEVEEL
jgi:hypothetical protein